MEYIKQQYTKKAIDRKKFYGRSDEIPASDKKENE